MFNFLEREGAQVLVEPIGTWIMYMIHQVIQKYKDFKGLEEGAVLPPIWKLGTRAKIEFGFRQKVAKLKLAEAIFKGEYHKIVERAGRHRASPGRPVRTAAPGPSLLQLARRRRRRPPGSRQEHLLLEQGPGAHGAVAEALRLHALARSRDGAQSAVVSNYKDMIYLPVETSGEGEINAHSRVQMALGEAKNKAKKEFAAALEETGLTLDQCRAWVEAQSRNQAPAVPGAAQEGRSRRRRELRASHRGPDGGAGKAN